MMKVQIKDFFGRRGGGGEGGGGQDRGTGQEICGEGIPSNHTVSPL